ncbi:uncharacterized protein PFL1_01483 [Pseudozyma flocculosa PF-1]|uniref:uncharacterized protein n=1 Tax=Pseudozyma flocculosa PF-1 TaxID=1277687 RepID=UPI0004560C41|nr:uncharacterized protein PFL1_01483 [Pseudozyma flocculosa PF-1]EPQ31298.1 hypothetical protein PFL1_01483 [Pseudozyma flocculosa PF-1]
MDLVEPLLCAFTAPSSRLLEQPVACQAVYLDPSDEFRFVDLHEFSSWTLIGCRGCAHFSIPPEFKQPLYDNLTAGPLKLQLQLFTAATSFAWVGHPDDDVRTSAGLSALGLVRALEEIGCHTMRFHVLWDKLSTLLDLHELNPADPVWAFSLRMLARGITLLRGPTDSAALTFASLGSLGGGFGAVDIPMSACGNGLCRIRVVQPLVRELGEFESDIGPVCIYGASVELYVRASTLEGAKQLLAASDALNWLRLIQGRPTGIPLEIRQISKNAYAAHIDAVTTEIWEQLAGMADISRDEAERTTMRLYRELGVVDPYAYPHGIDAFDFLRAAP